jgi:hypothetical protein
VVTALLPLVWAVDTDSCGGSGANPGPLERTGVDIVTQLDLSWWAVAPVVFVMVVAPYFAGRLGGIPRLVVHLVGLVATGVVGCGIFVAMFVTIFTERTLKAAGVLVAGAGVGAVADALFRVGAGGFELWKRRRAARE